MIKHNTYFGGAVQSLAFERNGRRQTVGVIAPGHHTFGTEGPERMTIVSGELSVKLQGKGEAVVYPQGSSFEVPAKSSFMVIAAQPCAYWCEFI